MMTKKQQAFVTTVLTFYKQNGRHELPWRQTHDPYAILVSEIMLQQTQVGRVIPKYEQFLKTFPTVESLASAPLGAVLTVWQGLGYNRRAKMLHACVQSIVRDYNGIWPNDYRTLTSLPGIGAYTASALLAFSFNAATPLIETNVRTVYLHHFFTTKEQVHDRELMPIIEATLDTNNPRDWYYALMDYGSYLKQTVGNKNKQSKQYTKQSVFKGSDRQIRGAIIRTLSNETNGVTIARLTAVNSELNSLRIQEQLSKLMTEGMVQKKSARYTLPT
ncbi:MAG: A/G-specific adenine glycosylase [Patescibacteria group bacterium]